MSPAVAMVNQVQPVPDLPDSTKFLIRRVVERNRAWFAVVTPDGTPFSLHKTYHAAAVIAGYR